jgi:hypothetical protein
MQHVTSPVASKENKGIGIVVDLQNFPSPTVVTRQFSSTTQNIVIDHQGRTRTSSVMNDVVAFGGYAPPPLSVRASDRIRA